jgi:indoleacetamide hydrolase
MNHRPVRKNATATAWSDVAISGSAEDRVLEMDCTDLIACIRAGSLRAELVCERFLLQYERQRSLNVITWVDHSEVLARARDVDRARDEGAQLPALAGLPILIKDNIDTVGWPTSAGTAFLKHFPDRNAPVVERLLKQGAIVMGKANMHELSFGATSSNPTFGFVRNPYNPDLIPGGSSGGSAAAIAARIVPAALGTDTIGSVRIPAAFCGTVGFRPSTYPRQLYSQQGVVPVLLDLDTIGLIGRSVADVAMLHAAIVGQPPIRTPSLAKARIGVPIHPYWSDLDPQVKCVAEAALERLRDQGAVAVEIDLRELNESVWDIVSALGSTGIADMASFLGARVPSVSLRDLTDGIASRDVCAGVKEKMATRPCSGLLDVRGTGRDALCAAYRAVIQQHGIQAVVFPTEVLPPPPIRPAGDDPDEMIELNGRLVPKLETLVRNTLLAAVLGTPALSLPAGLTRSGLPVALEFDGLPEHDSALLALGRAAEAAIGRISPPPQLFAVQHQFREA